MNTVLETHEVAVYYGGNKALDGVDVAIGDRGITGLIGPNGAGKSTLFNAICGLVRPTRGQVSFAGAVITGMRPEAVARLGIARTFQTPRTFPSLDLVDNLCVSATNGAESISRALIGGYHSSEAALERRALSILDRLGLASKASQRPGELSGGELRMLEVGRQLMRNPRLLLLDEPTAGANAALQRSLATLLRELRDDGVAVLVIEHNLHFLLALAEVVVVLHRGRKLCEGPPQEVRKDPRVVAAYLGRDRHVA